MVSKVNYIILYFGKKDHSIARAGLDPPPPQTSKSVQKSFTNVLQVHLWINKVFNYLHQHILGTVMAQCQASSPCKVPYHSFTSYHHYNLNVFLKIGSAIKCHSRRLDKATEKEETKIYDHLSAGLCESNYYTKWCSSRLWHETTVFKNRLNNDGYSLWFLFYFF